MSGVHSVLSPSKGAMILGCAASLGASKGVKDEPSQYAAEGTAYHEIAATALQAIQDGRADWGNCDQYVGQVVEADDFKFTIDEENAWHAQKYVDEVRKIPGIQYYEVCLDTSDVVGVPGQTGTGDFVGLDFEHDTIHSGDLKFGRGDVVFAEKNPQPIQYGAAALRKFSMLHDWKFVRVAIYQPRLNHFSDHTYTVEEIEAWIAENKPKFQLAYELYQDPSKIRPEHFNPGEKQCRWCPIRGKCAARASQFLTQFPITDPDDHPPSALMQPAATTLDDNALAAARDRVDAIEQWCSDIKAEAHTRAVVLGRSLPGWKVVNGRAGNRKWADDQKNFVEGALKTVLVDGAYKPREVISPADAEKKLKKLPETWALVLPAIVQAEGAKSLVRDDSPKQTVLVNQIEFPVQEAQG